MNDTVIRVEGLSKQYQLGARQKSYQTLRDTLVGAAARAARPFRRGGLRSAKHEHIWALRDVSFEIKAGEVVGIIGHNGCGKSTLLKILSRITEPTRGFAEIRGRVGSLLEVGTGFHPELTGRENIYLNGAILGMRRAEIARKFDEIVAFAEVEQFIDTPVKRYSSGMYLRLAFSVAAHMQPEILLVDEVLAVGDVMFQRKCIAKMNDVARQGQTVLFVSHNLAMIKDFCQRGLLLRHGRLLHEGRMLDCIGQYTRELYDEPQESTTGTSCFRRLVIQADGANVDAPVANDRELSVSATLVFSVPIHTGQLSSHIDASSGEKLAQSTLGMEDLPQPLHPGIYRVCVTVPRLWLAPDAYTLYLKFVGHTASGERIRFVSESILINVVSTDGPTAGSGRLKARILPPAVWTVRASEVATENTAANDSSTNLLPADHHGI